MFRWLQQRRFLAPLCVLLVVASLASCGLVGEDGRTLLRSDPPMRGYETSMQYTISSNTDGTAETNRIVWQGVNGVSPMPLQTTTFDKGAGFRSQSVDITGADGQVIRVLGMAKRDMNVGMTDYIQSQAATYEQRDAYGHRLCGAKVRLIFEPNGIQFLKDDEYRRAWDALFYYEVPCAGPVAPAAGEPSAVVPPATTLDLRRADLIGLTINQQFTPRITNDPIVFNRGHSVTVVGGRAANELDGGWWDSPAGLMNASDLVIDLVKDLDENSWEGFGHRSNGELVYSAGDADVYASWDRFFLDRQSEYLVNFREAPEDDWSRVLIVPEHNKEWNDWSDNYKALTNSDDAPNIDDLVDDKTGLPKDLDPESDDGAALKEIETTGCQNCPNPELEQIRFVDMTEGSRTYKDTLYAMTIRGYAGSHRSLVMFGDVPRSPSDYSDAADAHRRELQMTDCPVQRNNKGEREDRQYSDEECTEWLREGAMWDLLTQDADELTNADGGRLGFDVVGQFQVEDTSTWTKDCVTRNDVETCTTTAADRKLNASYMFSDTDEGLLRAWTVMQLLGEVGMRTLGMSYASELYGGSGLDFAMAQPQVYNSYWTDITANPTGQEMLFSLDARALQLPATLGSAREILYGS